MGEKDKGRHSRSHLEEDLKAHELFTLLLAPSQRTHCGRIPPEPN